MKLSELLLGQGVIVQLQWGEKTIEFYSNVVDKSGNEVFIEPYYHNGNSLDINVTQGKDVTCNIFTDNPNNRQRISWKNIELTTVKRHNVTYYCMKTSVFNNVAQNVDRRVHDRIVVQIKAKVYDGKAEEPLDVIIHDISDVGISFYASASFAPKSQLLRIEFADKVSDRDFEVKVECSIARTARRAGNTLIGCKINGENREYLLYGFMKRMNEKRK